MKDLQTHQHHDGERMVGETRAVFPQPRLEVVQVDVVANARVFAEK